EEYQGDDQADARPAASATTSLGHRCSPRLYVALVSHPGAAGCAEVPLPSLPGPQPLSIKQRPPTARAAPKAAVGPSFTASPVARRCRSPTRQRGAEKSLAGASGFDNAAPGG